MTKVLLLSFIVLTVLSAISGYGTPAKGVVRDWLKPRTNLARPQRLPDTHHIVSEERLKQIRSELLYPFSDQGGNDGYGDFQRGIQLPTPEIQKNFTFTLPFLGFHFNYIRVTINGYLGFSDPPEEYTYPLVFPIKRWPRSEPVSDPSFIGIFFSKMRIGNVLPEDIDQRRAGVYFKLETDLQTRTDQSGVELRDRLTRDVREGGVQGAENFAPKHAIIATWKNMSFLGGIDKSLDTTNTFQVVLATDEVRTFAIFNYADLHWLSHTEAGGDTVTGMGGVAAYVGFNGGNGTQAFEYLPYSQSPSLLQITKQGCGNGFHGRHIFQIDEKIILASCKNIR